MDVTTHDSLAAFDDATLADLFTRVYEGYAMPVHADAAIMRFMRVAFGWDLGASRVRRDGGAPVAMAILARRGEAGWIGGMGVIASHRGRALGEAIMRDVLDSARGLGLTRVGLEVLVQNTHAIRVYERLGFGTTRELEVWSFPAPEFADDGPALAPVPVAEARAFVAAHRVAPEPWQRADGTVDALIGDGTTLEGLLATRDGRAVGALVARVTGERASVLQLATAPGEAAAATRALLASLRRDDAPNGVRWLNAPAGEPCTEWVRTLQPTTEARQFEMELVL